MSESSKPALVLVAHGSRREASNDEVRGLSECLGRQQDGQFAQVGCGFLELAEPSIPDSIIAQIKAGHNDVVVLPYFLSKGRHVAEDIPEEVDKVRAEYPQANIRIAPYLGESTEMIQMLLNMAGE